MSLDIIDGGKALSLVMRRNLCVYDLPESEQRLAHWLVIESFDQGKVCGRVDFDGWSRALGFADSKGLRPDKCVAVFESLVSLRLVNWNRLGAEQTGPNGTYALLPHAQHWSRLRRMRSVTQTPPTGTQELAFCVARELDDALCSASRENAIGLGNGPNPVHLPLQQGSTQDRPVPGDGSNPVRLPLQQGMEVSAENADVGGKRRNVSAEKSAENENEQKSSVKPRVFVSADFSAEKQLASYDPSKNPSLRITSPGSELASSASAEKSARTGVESAGEAIEWLRSVDRRRTLDGRFGADYRALCEREPAYVLTRLRGKLEAHQERAARGQTYQVADPVGWIGKTASDEGKMPWRGKGFRELPVMALEKKPEVVPTMEGASVTGPDRFTWEMAMSWLRTARECGADYTEVETRSAFMALGASGFMWGNNPIVNFQWALERQVQSDRARNAPKEKRVRRPDHGAGF